MYFREKSDKSELTLKGGERQKRTYTQGGRGTKINLHSGGERDKNPPTLSTGEGQKSTYTQQEGDKNPPTLVGGGQKSTYTLDRRGTKIHPLYKHLITPNNYLKETVAPDGNQKSLFAAAAFCECLDSWHFEDAHQSFAKIAVGDLLGFCKAVGIAGGEGRNRLVASGATVETAVSWYLYALHDQLSSHMLPGYLVNRIAEGDALPKKQERFLQLASLSWELWRSYAAATYTNYLDVSALAETPLYAMWNDLYAWTGGNDARMHLRFALFAAGYYDTVQ